MTVSDRYRRRALPHLLATATLVIGAGSAQAQQATSPATAPATAQPVETPQAQAPSNQPGTDNQAAPLGDAATAAPQDDAAGGDIVVTGYRQSIEQSLSRKREANAFVDVITAEDIGKFPDKNVADSLQRVPGIIIDRDGGEGSRVSIRGLQSDLTLTQLNGNFIASADDNEPSRSFNYLLLPSNMIGSVDVFKSPEARLDEGGVGGTIILHTRRPLDLKSLSGFISAEGTYADVTKKVEPQIGGQLSWKNADETFGVLVGGTYQVRTVRDHRAAASSWNWWTYDRASEPATDVNGNTFANDDAISYWPENTGATTQSGQRYSGYWAPQQVSQTITDQRRKRLGIQATAQMKPFEDFTVTANYFRFQVNDNFVSNGIQIPEWGYGNFFSGASLDPSGTIFQSAQFTVPQDGTGCRVQVGNQPPCTMETPQIYGTYSREKSVSNTFDVEGAFARDRFEATFKIGKTRATGGPSGRFSVAAKPRVVNGTSGINGNLYSAWNFTDQSANFEFSPELQDNINKGLTQIDLGSTNSSFNRSRIDQRYAQLDLTRKFETFLDLVQIGAKWRDGGVHRSTGRNEWYADPATQLRYQDTPGAATTQPGFFFDKPIGNIAGGFTGNAFPAIDFQNYLNYLNTTYGEAVRVDETDFVYDIGERIWAGYVQTNFKTDRFRGNIGLRVRQHEADRRHVGPFAAAVRLLRERARRTVRDAAGRCGRQLHRAAARAAGADRQHAARPDPDVRRLAAERERGVRRDREPAAARRDRQGRLPPGVQQPGIAAQPDVPHAGICVRPASVRRARGLVGVGRQQCAQPVQGVAIRHRHRMVLQARIGAGRDAVPQGRVGLHRAAGARRDADGERRAGSDPAVQHGRQRLRRAVAGCRGVRAAHAAVRSRRAGELHLQRYVGRADHGRRAECRQLAAGRQRQDAGQRVAVLRDRQDAAPRVVQSSWRGRPRASVSG